MAEEARDIRVLVIAEAANPTQASVPLVGWSHAEALARRCRAHRVTQIRNRDAWLAAGVPESEFTAIDSEKIAAPMYRIGEMLRGGAGKGWTTMMAINQVSYRYFERLVWRRFKDRLIAKQFDIVHRITPLSPTVPSSLAVECAKIGVPYVLGPLNGGIPWPREFDAERRKEKEWLSYVRGMSRLMPGYAATRAKASAILCASRYVWDEMPESARARCFYMPENGIDPRRFSTPDVRGPACLPLRVIFLGRLVPYKGADMLLEAAAGLIKAGKIVLDVVGNGPDLELLRGIVERENISGAVTFHGWVDHARVAEYLGRADVLGFPSVREFGGGVALEAMSMGVAPLIVDYGGPGELVSPATGIAVPMGNRREIVERVRAALERLVSRPELAREMGARGRARVARHFTWDAKAAREVELYEWLLRRRERPVFPMPIPDEELGAMESA